MCLLYLRIIPITLIANIPKVFYNSYEEGMGVMQYCCAHCGRKLSSRNVKVCPGCKQRLYKTKGDIVNCDDPCLCPDCRGTGKVTVWSVAGNIPITEKPCTKCNGSGRIC